MMIKMKNLTKLLATTSLGLSLLTTSACSSIITPAPPRNDNPRPCEEIASIMDMEKVRNGNSQMSIDPDCKGYVATRKDNKYFIVYTDLDKDARADHFGEGIYEWGPRLPIKLKVSYHHKNEYTLQEILDFYRRLEENEETK